MIIHKLTKDQASGLNVCLDDLHRLLFRLGVESSIAKNMYVEGQEFTTAQLDELRAAQSECSDMGEWFGEIADAVDPNHDKTVETARTDRNERSD